ncbi:MAG: hypothetical protein GX446_12705 [Chthonomonadales bacterium]|nr:hypothetical protein [Chthonomonadales bacterium]
MNGTDDRPKIKSWNTADWSLRHELTGPKRRILSVAVAPDGSTVACLSGDTPEQYGLTIWRVSDGTERASYTGSPNKWSTLT